MKRKLYIIIGIGAALFGVVPKTLAQSVTYNHDDAKMNQITVAEIGSGSLTPEFYYWLLHNSYRGKRSGKETNWVSVPRRASTCTTKLTKPRRWIQP